MNSLNWLTSPSALPAIEREIQARDFEAWLWAVSPAWRWDWPHLAYIREHLAAVTAGEISNLMIFMPPRHGKSEMVTVRYPIWRMEREPGTQVIVGAYNQRLASLFGAKARRIAETRLKLASDTQAKDEWEIEGGGGYRAVGVGAGITGFGAHLIIIDDPVKSREEANSATYRDRVWDWYREVLYTRREPGAAMILIMTRWHEDDLAGRILASEMADNWVVLSLPAEAEEHDPLGRPLGAALCPERYTKDQLKERRLTLGNAYYALYQQRPQPIGGGMFKRGNFKIVGGAPVDAIWVRYWDKAATSGGRGSRTAGVLMGRDRRDGSFVVADAVFGRWDVGERENVIRQTADSDALKYRNVTIGLEQEPGSAGKESAQATVRRLAGYTVRAMRPTGDKITRAEPVAAQVDAGNVRLVHGKWNSEYLDELAAFPHGMTDDLVDATSGAFGLLTRVREAKVERFLR